MSVSFHRVSHTLARDSGKPAILGIVSAVAVVTIWTVWALTAKVTRYEATDSARFEVHGSAYPIQADAGGQIVLSRLVLDRQVHRGDVLAELDSESQQLKLKEAETRLATFDPQIAVLRAQMNDQNAGRLGERTAFGMSVAEARAKYQQAEAQAALADSQADRANRLWSNGLIPLAEEERAKAESKSLRAAAEDMRIAISRLEPEQRVRESDRDTKVSQIQADIAKLEADKSTTEAEISSLRFEIERRTIRATVDGKLSDCAVLRPGSYVTAGEKIGTILPGEALQIIAEFPPQLAFGKLKPGQPARVKLKGFPWTQYGVVPARVSRVAGDVREGQVRVELAVISPGNPRVHLEHGLPGSVEVEVERISPAALLLRSAGRFTGSE